MEWEEELKSEGKNVIVVPGNHDEIILSNRQGYSSSELWVQGKNFEELHEELSKDPIAKQYLEQLVGQLDKPRTKNGQRLFLDPDKLGTEYKVKVIHGGMRGDCSAFGDLCPDRLKVLWNRLDEDTDFRASFKVMARWGFGIVIRGHDHPPKYA